MTENDRTREQAAEADRRKLAGGLPSWLIGNPDRIAQAMWPVVNRIAKERAARREAEALAPIRALLPRIDDLIEFEQEGGRDATAVMQVRNHLRAALGEQEARR